MNFAVGSIGSESPFRITRGRGQSEASESLYELFRSLCKDWTRTATGNAEEALADSIGRIRKRCARRNWDGEDAALVSAGTAIEAVHLSRVLPSLFPLPEVDADPDGSISFLWRTQRRYSFLMSVYGDGKLVFAGLFGEQGEVHGSETLRDVLPDCVIGYLRRLYSR